MESTSSLEDNWIKNFLKRKNSREVLLSSEKQVQLLALCLGNESHTNEELSK